MGKQALQKEISKKNINRQRERQMRGESRLLKMKGVKLGLIPTMTRANRINPPSLEEGRGWWGFKLRQALQRVKHSQRQTTDSLRSTKI